ncbi:DNA mismatch repair protein MutS [Nitrosococcus halophilus Nc 4]|uniref:DNA mismatch repair protein MutS n=1 Tax=Nitrosococcus halophilus (strain Nc4) TaxID=472759 RepID=D5C3L4_NITHN|nr:DNA mismatch repair protein MutS [Nitrosococcus halophilus]ADE14986.1 DNA mismatch repair protein MutS [Nitrosococcus halophilus Nc 4]
MEKCLLSSDWTLLGVYVRLKVLTFFTVKAVEQGKGRRNTQAVQQPPETDMMAQYRGIKAQYQDALLFFRFGDFYEMFYEDAALASRELDIVLTSRPQAKNSERVPMCGVPYHRLETYVARLIGKGHKVAICEQLEGASKGRGLIQREVIRVVTPGTFFEAERQEGALAALCFEGEQIGMALLQLATGEFLLLEASREELPGVLSRFRPQEILLQEGQRLEALPHYQPFIAEQPAEAFIPEQALTLLADHFGREAIASLVPTARQGLVAAGVLLGYVKETQMGFLPHLQVPKQESRDQFVFLDAQTQRNLELVENIYQGTEEGTLLAVLDRARTSMGRRRLKRWLLHPLRAVTPIQERQDAVAELVLKHSLRTRLQEALAQVLDLERLTSRITSAVANPRDLVALRTSLAPLPLIHDLLSATPIPLLHGLGSQLDVLEDLHAEIQRVLVDEPRVTVKEGGLIRPGVCAELDELHAVGQEGTGWLANYEQQERDRTQIGNLKVGFNKVFGYYIEITKSNLGAVPLDYQRRQTLANAERFITDPLKAFEQQTLLALERAKELEYQRFVELRDQVATQAARLRQTAEVLGTLDGLASLGEVAASQGWVKPEVSEGHHLTITEGRHPVVESLRGEFVPNDLHLGQDPSFLILTGPNAAGKSTYARQAAILVLLAQIGSFVPAETAHIGVVDRIFTRVGAADFLARGLSTFMMEMMETANILRYATSKSLVILDEVGRGTGTSDGQAIAQAVAEMLAQEIKARTLFTTHYHQLAALADRIPSMANARLAVREEQEEVSFLYKVVPGAAPKSYGIYVAKLAGLPPAVVQRASELLAQLEQEESVSPVGNARAEVREVPPPSGWLRREALVARLLELDPLRTTPLEALELLAELRHLAQSSSRSEGWEAAPVMPFSKQSGKG